MYGLELHHGGAIEAGSGILVVRGIRARAKDVF